MSRVDPRNCAVCHGPLVRTATGYECGQHVESDIEQCQGYVIDLQSPWVYSDWDGPEKACLPVEKLPEPKPIWLSKAQCCAWWEEPDWEDDWCATCEDYMEPEGFVATCTKCGHTQHTKNWCEVCKGRTTWDNRLAVTAHRSGTDTSHVEES